MKPYFFDTLRPALVIFIVLSILTGGIYPALVTGVAQYFMPYQANGSLIQDADRVHGSELIGQAFSSPKYFWSRPSATSPMPNNASASSGSNLGPLNKALMDTVAGRVALLKENDPSNKLPVPVDLVTASASGLDPHISVAAAIYQVGRVSTARSIPIDRVQDLLKSSIEEPFLGLIGERQVNVVKLNRALDRMR